jgi:RimJ/RimL family protein N-acetyltransferase
MELKLKLSLLRSWVPSDATALQRYANNRNIWANLRDVFPHPYTLENATAFLACVAHENPESTLAIATSTEAIGCIGLRRGSDIHHLSAELGYWLAEPFWGRGIMSEAVTEFTRHAFANSDLERIYAEPFATNLASACVLEKAGFICEGRMNSSICKDGKVLDSFLYARTRTREAS